MQSVQTILDKPALSAAEDFLQSFRTSGSWILNNARIPPGTDGQTSVLEAPLLDNPSRSIILVRKRDASGHGEYSGAIIERVEGKPVILLSPNRRGIGEAFEQIEFSLASIPNTPGSRANPYENFINSSHLALTVDRNLGLDHPQVQKIVAAALQTNCEIKISVPTRHQDFKLNNLATLGSIRLEIDDHVLLKVTGPEEDAREIRRGLITLPHWYPSGFAKDFRTDMRA